MPYWIIGAAVWLMVFGLHQWSLSLFVYIVRKGIRVQWQELQELRRSSSPGAVFAPNVDVSQSRLGQAFEKAGSAAWFVGGPFYTLVPLGALFVVTITTVNLGIQWWGIIYYSILIIDLVLLIGMKRETVQQTRIDRLWWVFPTIQYPNKFYNVFFQSPWPAFLFFIVVVIMAYVGYRG